MKIINENKYRFFIIFAALTAWSFNLFAQQPVGTEFYGEWLFDNAQAQERLLNSQKDYSVRSVSQDEFWQKVYFLNMPIQIFFMDEYLTHITHPSWSKPVVALINDGKLEFRIFQEDPARDYDKKMDISEIHLYPTMMPVYDINLNGNQLSLQCNYIYPDEQGNYIEGILTINYKRN